MSMPLGAALLGVLHLLPCGLPNLLPFGLPHLLPFALPDLLPCRLPAMLPPLLPLGAIAAFVACMLRSLAALLRWLRVGVLAAVVVVP
jgi:hypothetical protein